MSRTHDCCGVLLKGIIEMIDAIIHASAQARVERLASDLEAAQVLRLWVQAGGWGLQNAGASMPGHAAQPLEMSCNARTLNYSGAHTWLLCSLPALCLPP
jgi:hypothetical protein